jgi:hypothetical protein
MQRDRFRSEEPNRSHEEGMIISRCRTKRLQIGRASPEWLSVLLDALFSVLAFAGAALNELDEPLPEARLEGCTIPGAGGAPEIAASAREAATGR